MRVFLLTLVLALAAPVAHATAQVANVLELEGKRHALWSEPLHGSGLHIENVPGWGRSTACWAGYRSAWAIEDGQLWFTGLRECHGSRSQPAGSVLREVDDAVSRIPAAWFSGNLVLPQGNLIHYVHGGWASLYAQERRITIAAGHVVSDTVVQLVPEGFVALPDNLWAPTLLIPRDIQQAEPKYVQEGERSWDFRVGDAPSRALRVRCLPDAGLVPEAGVLEAVDQLLTDQLGTPPAPDRQHRTLETRGTLAWEDHLNDDGTTVIRTVAWAGPQRMVVLELWPPPDAAEERDTFIALLDLPSW